MPVYGEKSFAIIANTRAANRLWVADTRVYLKQPSTFHDPVPVVMYGRGAKPVNLKIPAGELKRYRVESVPEFPDQNFVARMGLEDAESVLEIHQPFNQVDDEEKVEALKKYAEGK